jgi:hypothetical protein
MIGGLGGAASFLAGAIAGARILWYNENALKIHFGNISRP